MFACCINNIFQPFSFIDVLQFIWITIERDILCGRNRGGHCIVGYANWLNLRKISKLSSNSGHPLGVNHIHEINVN